MTCWNFGGNHTFKDCTEPHDKVQIAKSQKDLFDNKREQDASDDTIDPAPHILEPDAPDASEGAGAANSNNALNVTWDDKPSNLPGQVLGDTHGTGVTQ